jgi:proliferating cell nuclear antigen PCNA
MHICIRDKKKKDAFVSLFQVIKNCSTLINATFETEGLFIQGLDKSHICLFNVVISKKWFTNYDLSETDIANKLKLCFDANVFQSIISTKSDNQDLIIKTDDTNADILYIHFESCENKKGDYKKSFKMPLADYEYQEMHIPEVEYDAEFSVSSKEISDIFAQLSNFGNDIIINCSDEEVRLMTNGVTGEMRVDIPVDDLSTYSVVEGESTVLTYSLVYVNKMCITNKLSNEIEFSLSNQCPMKIHYNLGDDSSLVFYIAPKMDE